MAADERVHPAARTRPIDPKHTSFAPLPPSSFPRDDGDTKVDHAMRRDVYSIHGEQVWLRMASEAGTNPAVPGSADHLVSLLSCRQLRGVPLQS